MKRLLLIPILQFYACSAFSQWSNLGLNGHQVNDLTVYADTIYASTDDGIYKKSILTTDTIWESCGEQGHYIVQTLVENYNTFISLKRIEGTFTNQIYKSTDAGLTFSLMNSSTSNFNYYQYLDHMAHPVNNYDTLYFLNHQLKTNDGGDTWETLNSNVSTDRFIIVNPTNHAQLIIGGEGDLFNAYLQISNDYGETWDFPAMNSFFAGDNAIHDIAIDESIWYAAGEGVICQTTDGGDNWTQLVNLFDDNSAFSLYYTNIEFSPVSKDILYVSGINSNDSYKVPLLYSDNQGATWDTTSYHSSHFDQKMRCLTVENIDNSDCIFIGGKGVYVYKRMVSNLSKIDNQLDFGLYPNPASDKLNINYASTANGPLTASVFDLQGRLISQQKQMAMGKETFTIDTSTLSQGSYVLQLIDGEKTGSREFVVR
jgi:hypothetical protein